MKNFIRKTVGFILTGIAGWAFAWHQAAAASFISSVGGFVNIILIVVGIVAIILAIFWPKKWHETLRQVVIGAVFLVLIILLFTGGGKLLENAFMHSPWLTILSVIAFVIVVLVLHGITVLETPIATWKARFRRNRP